MAKGFSPSVIVAVKTKDNIVSYDSELTEIEVLKESNSSIPVTFYIDFENVPTDGFTGLELIRRKDKVIVYFSERSPSIRIDILQKILEYNISLKFRKVEFGSPNALDFQLVAELGHEYGQGRNRCIISKDTGFDAAVNALNKYGFSRVYRYANFKEFYANAK